MDKEDLDDAVKLIGAGAADDAKRLHDAMEVGTKRSVPWRG